MCTRFVLLLAVVSLLAACGSDGDQLSEEEFLAQANEICRVGNQEINDSFEALFADFPEEPTEEEVQQIIDENGQTLLDDFESNLGGQIDDLRDLNGPSDLEDELDRSSTRHPRSSTRSPTPAPRRFSRVLRMSSPTSTPSSWRSG